MAGATYFEWEQHGDVAVVRLADPRTMPSLMTAELQEALVEAVDQRRPKKMVLDFARVTYCTSEVIEAAIRVKRRVGADGGQVRLCGLAPEVREAFQLLNLEGTVFQVFDSVPDAAASF